MLEFRAANPRRRRDCGNGLQFTRVIQDAAVHNATQNLMEPSTETQILESCLGVDPGFLMTGNVIYISRRNLPTQNQTRKRTAPRQEALAFGAIVWKSTSTLPIYMAWIDTLVPRSSSHGVTILTRPRRPPAARRKT
jgi:hypothetical protein